MPSSCFRGGPWRRSWVCVTFVRDWTNFGISLNARAYNGHEIRVVYSLHKVTYKPTSIAVDVYPHKAFFANQRTYCASRQEQILNMRLKARVD